MVIIFLNDLNHHTKIYNIYIYTQFYIELIANIT